MPTTLFDHAALPPLAGLHLNRHPLRGDGIAVGILHQQQERQRPARLHPPGASARISGSFLKYRLGRGHQR